MAPKNKPGKTENTTEQKSATAWIDGAKPHFQTLRLSHDAGRIFVGAKGWNKAMGRSEWVSLELNAAGLDQLIKASQRQLATLQES